ncbi:MAG: class I SAM-dependent methyltransferase [Anaerolineae bacterium]
MSSQYERRDQVYRKYPPEALPWELGRPRKVLVDLVESGKVKPGKALDICCGMGTNALYMAEKGFQVQGIDISPKATEYAREKAEKAGAEISFSVENAVYLPFADEQFDFVFDMGCFHHISVEERAVPPRRAPGAEARGQISSSLLQLPERPGLEPLH